MGEETTRPSSQGWNWPAIICIVVLLWRYFFGYDVASIDVLAGSAYVVAVLGRHNKMAIMDQTKTPS